MRYRIAGLLGLVLSVGITPTTSAETPVTILGKTFGSLDCLSVQDLDKKFSCNAGGLSNGKGCKSLANPALREQCHDQKFIPQGYVSSKPKLAISLDNASLHETVNEQITQPVSSSKAIKAIPLMDDESALSEVERILNLHTLR